MGLSVILEAVARRRRGRLVLGRSCKGRGCLTEIWGCCKELFWIRQVLAINEIGSLRGFHLKRYIVVVDDEVHL